MLKYTNNDNSLPLPPKKNGIYLIPQSKILCSLGAHINPSITLGMAVIRAISPLRAAMYITAQCGGGIAGAALLYG